MTMGVVSEALPFGAVLASLCVGLLLVMVRQ